MYLFIKINETKVGKNKEVKKHVVNNV